jgi:hypothetical protein
MVRPDTGVTIALATFGSKSPESLSPDLQEFFESRIAESTQTPRSNESAAEETASRTPATPEKEKARRFEDMVAATPWFKTRESDNKFIAGVPFLA